MNSELGSSAVTALQPDAIQAYLRARGWVHDGQEGPNAAAYVKHSTGAEVLVATRATAPDYAIVTRVLIERVARAEGMSRDALLRDLSMAGFDVLRVRVVDADDGAVDLDRGLSVVREARATLVAAATAAAAKAPRKNYAGRQPESVGAFVDRVRMGQTERGSFVIPLLTPYAFDPGDISLLPGEWFGRRVMRKLTSGLQAVALALANPVGSPDNLIDAAPQGVSANLCLALGRLVEAAGDVELAIRWATTAPEDAAPEPVRLPERSSPVLLEAAAYLANVDPPPAEPIIGMVAKLDEEEAVIDTVVEGKRRMVHLQIPEDQRTAFARAWDARLPIYLNGELHREGRKLTVKKAAIITPRVEEEW